MSEVDNAVDEKLLELHLELKKTVLDSLKSYENVMKCLYTDVPISSLNLDKKTKAVLKKEGLNRLYEVINLDLSKIEGLCDRRRADLTACLDQFLSMSF